MQFASVIGGDKLISPLIVLFVGTFCFKLLLGGFPTV